MVKKCRFLKKRTVCWKWLRCKKKSQLQGIKSSRLYSISVTHGVSIKRNRVVIHPRQQGETKQVGWGFPVWHTCILLLDTSISPFFNMHMKKKTTNPSNGLALLACTVPSVHTNQWRSWQIIWFINIRTRVSSKALRLVNNSRFLSLEGFLNGDPPG